MIGNICDNLKGYNCGHSGDRLSQNGEKQQVKTTTTRVYTFTARKMWFRNYYVAHVFVLKNCFLLLSHLKIHIILVLDRLRGPFKCYVTQVGESNFPEKNITKLYGSMLLVFPEKSAT